MSEKKGNYFHSVNQVCFTRVPGGIEVFKLHIAGSDETYNEADGTYGLDDLHETIATIPDSIWESVVKYSRPSSTPTPERVDTGVSKEELEEAARRLADRLDRG